MPDLFIAADRALELKRAASERKAGASTRGMPVAEEEEAEVSAEGR